MAWTPPVHDRSRELREQLEEAGWHAAMAEIAARHGLGEVEAPFASGSDVVWEVGEHVVKLTAPLWRGEIEAEARWLRHVAGRLPVRTPEAIATGELAGWPYVVTSRVPGVALAARWPELGRADRLRLAADLGETTRALHALPIPPGPDGWDDFWRACRSNVAARHAHPEVPRPLLEEIEPFLASVGPLESAARVVLHTELLGEHVLALDRGGRLELAALIDFADGRVGAPEYELAAPVEFILRGEPGLLDAFLRALGGTVDPDPERLLAWALCHRFGRLARSLRAVLPARPTSLGELARRLHGS